MKKEMIKRYEGIPERMAVFFGENDLGAEWRSKEHDGCWDKGCSHFGGNELNIWRGNERRISWSFEEGCGVDMVIETLKDRLSSPSPL